MPSRTLPWIVSADIARIARECFPALSRRCSVCGVLTQGTHRGTIHSEMLNACDVCRARLPQRTAGFCPRCGKLFDVSTEPPTPCLDCRISPPPWHEVIFYGAYDDLLKSLVLRFKFQAQLGLGQVLHALLRSALETRTSTPYDLVVPIPLHPRKLRQRGFNQSLELAKGLSTAEHGPLNFRAVIRTRNTPAQHTLPRVKRMYNLRGAFLADRLIVHGRSVLLVDDILTTGATAHAATRALIRAGAGKVSLLVLARA